MVVDTICRGFATSPCSTPPLLHQWSLKISMASITRLHSQQAPPERVSQLAISCQEQTARSAAAFPLHTSLAGSNASFSARPSRRAQTFSAYARAENAPSRSKRPRFTEEEDAKLVDLKQRGWLWEDIQRSFPGRSTGSLQVRYSTKLKERNTAS